MANAKVIAEKELAVSQIVESFKKSPCTIVTDYRGLNVAEITQLRKLMREAGIEFAVIKNTLARRATAKLDLTDLDQYLTGPTAIAFGKNDIVAPAKILSDFAKKNDKLNVKAGVVEGKVVDNERIKALSELPSREGLLSMLLSVLQAPVRNFALSIKAVSEKKASS
jgi:large subunit ribosomal protein L10